MLGKLLFLLIFSLCFSINCWEMNVALSNCDCAFGHFSSRHNRFLSVFCECRVCSSSTRGLMLLFLEKDCARLARVALPSSDLHLRFLPSPQSFLWISNGDSVHTWVGSTLGSQTIFKSFNWIMSPSYTKPQLFPTLCHPSCAAWISLYIRLLGCPGILVLWWSNDLAHYSVASFCQGRCHTSASFLCSR
jgi:hypothetical protein